MLSTLSEPERVELLEPPATDVPMVLDTDAYNEVDDQFAIAYSCRALDCEAIYAAPFHNDRSEGPGDGMEKSYDELERVLDRLPDLDRVPETFRGSDRYLPGPDEPVASPAATDLIERARKERDGPLYVVAIGAPTNVSSALIAAPEIADRIVVVWLGGQPHGWHTAREFNLQQDIHASRTLFDSGVPLVQIPCKNVAEHVRTTVPELERCLGDVGEIGPFLVDRVAEYGDGRLGWSKVIWDIAAVAYLRNPDWLRSHLTASPRLSDDYTWARDPSRHLIRVASDADRDAIFQDCFESLGQDLD